MTEPLRSFEALVNRVQAVPVSGTRRLIALAGPPGSGKSTVAARLVAELGTSGQDAALVPMDGFHLDNRVLARRGLLPRKGAPETFDAGGFERLVAALHAPGEVAYPVFDRDRDIAIAGAGVVAEECKTVVLEGNYLLFGAAPWHALRPHWDLAVYIDAPEDVLARRLTARWLDQGLSPELARTRAEGNDLPNARRVASHRMPADVVFENLGDIGAGGAP